MNDPNDVLPETLTGRRFRFYGAVNNQFRVREVAAKKMSTYDVVEDESDGYRSSMRKLRVVTDPDKFEIYPGAPFATVTVREDTTKQHEFWRLVDEREHEHVWLLFGTDNTDDYYPFFVFEYTPLSCKEDGNAND